MDRDKYFYREAVRQAAVDVLAERIEMFKSRVDGLLPHCHTPEELEAAWRECIYEAFPDSCKDEVMKRAKALGIAWDAAETPAPRGVKGGTR